MTALSNYRNSRDAILARDAARKSMEQLEAELRRVFRDYPEYSDPELGGQGFEAMVEKFADDAFFKLHHEARAYRERTAGPAVFAQGPDCTRPRRILTADTARSGELLIQYTDTRELVRVPNTPYNRELRVEKPVVPSATWSETAERLHAVADRIEPLEPEYQAAWAAVYGPNATDRLERVEAAAAALNAAIFAEVAEIADATGNSRATIRQVFAPRDRWSVVFGAGSITPSMFLRGVAISRSFGWTGNDGPSDGYRYRRTLELVHQHLSQRAAAEEPEPALEQAPRGA